MVRREAALPSVECARFLNSCYRPTIERANAIAPQHSRIFKEVCHYLYARTRCCIAELRSR